MYYTESMVQMLEDLQLQASEMEKQVKDMMELEGRALGIELDKRKRARDLYDELVAHQASMEQSQPMTWAYVPEEIADYDCNPDHSYLEGDYAPESIEQHDEVHYEEPVVEEHVEEAPVDVAPVEDAPVDEVPHDFVESPEVAPVEEHVEPVPVEEPAPVEEPIQENPDQPQG